MSDLFQAITFEYLESPNAPARPAVTYFDRVSPVALANTLRHHSDKPVETNIAITRRASFDALLSYCALIELAYQEQLLDASDEEVLHASVARIVKDPTVRNYYEWYYPYLLPSLLRLRLEGRPERLVEGVGSYRRFVRFWELTRELHNEVPNSRHWTEVELFWWLLEDGITEDGYSVGDLVRAFQRERRVARALAGAAQNELDSAIRGMYRFLDVAVTFEPFVAEMPDAIASAYWHFFGYWFERVGNELSVVVFKCLEKLERPDGANLLLQRISRLTSGRYSYRLRERVFTSIPHGEPIAVEQDLPPAGKRKHVRDAYARLRNELQRQRISLTDLQSLVGRDLSDDEVRRHDELLRDLDRQLEKLKARERKELAALGWRAHGGPNGTGRDANAGKGREPGE